ncbi:hypothetical protein D0Z08_05840 [Nocardioides immobilis]|uniref:Uncharacterized protein n=1 Tax=Nocardioides immobilis TaxID=2049295 RepID=A0A417Y557_9ACTN|nr:hypothetical protein [Nocardioides immobilis]RHW27818.1 hypothetical protein D0Z08_05840 [Nocardioides immobilis]
MDARRLLAALLRRTTMLLRPATHAPEPDEMANLAEFRAGVGRRPAMTPERRQMFDEFGEKLAGVAVWRDRPSSR